jgi:hypothetical protein
MVDLGEAAAPLAVHIACGTSSGLWSGDTGCRQCIPIRMP